MLRVRAHSTPNVRPATPCTAITYAIVVGFENLVWHQVHLRSGIYLFKGALTNFYLSQRFNLKYTDLNLLIASQR